MFVDIGLLIVLVFFAGVFVLVTAWGICWCVWDWAKTTIERKIIAIVKDVIENAL